MEGEPGNFAYYEVDENFLGLSLGCNLDECRV